MPAPVKNYQVRRLPGPLLKSHPPLHHMFDHLSGENVDLGNKYTKMIAAGVAGLLLVLVAPNAANFVCNCDILSGQASTGNGTSTAQLIPADLLHRVVGAGQFMGMLIALGVIVTGAIKLELGPKKS
ncbi:MAG: hypothetical protein KGI33_12025 [Thaumarchaeota archaeon]|nr:hypothetical protein [Nitrososphaerota archaeon]